MEKKQSPGYWELLQYFFPIALQSASQSITYPLVGVIATNGSGGPLELAGLAQSNSILFLIGTLGAGLITTGMVYGKTSEGFKQFTKINNLITVIVLILQGFCAIPVISHWLFASLMGMPDSIEPFAASALVATLPLHVLFFMRNPYQVLLYLNKKTVQASSATIARIICTVSTAPLFCYFKLTGVIWAAVALSLGVLVEVVLSWYFARKLHAELESKCSVYPSIRDLFAFTLPLSMGGLFLAISSVVIGMVITRAQHAEVLIPIFYLALGIANPMAFAATRNQTLTVAFPPFDKKDKSLFYFAVISGLLLGFVPLVLTLPGLVQMYYVKMQNVPSEQISLIRITSFALLLHPLGVAIRSYYEGMAANMKRPSTVLTGQAVYMSVLSVLAVSFLVMKVPGNLIGPVSFVISNIVAAAVIHRCLTDDLQRKFAGTARKTKVPAVNISSNMRNEIES